MASTDPPTGDPAHVSDNRRRGFISRDNAITMTALAAAAALVLALSLLTTTSRGVAPATPDESASADVSPPARKAPAKVFYEQAGPPAGSPLEPVTPLRISVSDSQIGTALRKGTAGISLEATDLADPTLSSDNASMVKLLKELDGPVLRFGGNAADRRFLWTSTNESPPASYQGDNAHPVKAVGPDDLRRLNTLLEASDAMVTLTVDLGHYDPARAADMAQNASMIFGDRLLGITIGNEPNGYAASGVRTAGYSVEEYVTELQAYAEAMYATAPTVPIAGPGAYDQKWWDAFLHADIRQSKILSFHHYPLHSCDGADSQSSPRISNLISQQMHTRAAAFQQAALDAGRAAGLEVWLPETGIAACPGANETSRTHASALWTADYILNAAQLGVTRIGFHSSLLTCQGGPPMSAICSGGTYLLPNGKVSGRANYFGIAMIADLQEGAFLKTDITGGGLVFTYALQNADGGTTVVVVNQNDPEKSAQTHVTLRLPGKARTGKMSQLTGPKYGAENSTLIDGAKGMPTPLARRLTAPGFRYGSATQTFKLTAGTVTVLHFTY